VSQQAERMSRISTSVRKYCASETRRSVMPALVAGIQALMRT
jgi:hypothetical protein